MDADRPLKTLFRLRAADLLPLTGDRGARVVESLVPEIAAVTRRVDFVLKLARGREVYLRHLEFEQRCRKGLALRVFEYAAALAARHRLPVASTVIVLHGKAPPYLVHEERIAGEVVCHRRIPVVRLERMKPHELMALGVGGNALVGLSAPRSLDVLAEAAERIRETAAPAQVPDLLAILRMLSEGRYTARELERVVPKEVVMGSSLIASIVKQSRAEGRAEGRVKGRVEGRVEGEAVNARRLCADLIRQLHPTVAPLVTPTIATCNDVAQLRRWVLAAPTATDRELVALIEGDEQRPTKPVRRATVPRAARAKR